MSAFKPLFVEGTIVRGSHAGMTVRVEEDIPNSGSFLILLLDENRPDAGADYWVERYDDLAPFFKEAGWEVVWEAPLDTLLRAREGD